MLRFVFVLLVVVFVYIVRLLLTAFECAAQVSNVYSRFLSFLEQVTISKKKIRPIQLTITEEK